jgi:hypothetical protein
VYRGMKRITLAVVAVLLAVPALAQAKAGIEFDQASDSYKAGERQTFTAMVMNEPSNPMGGEPEPIVGVRPLVTFRNAQTGELLRVRTGRTNSEGIARGAVTFPGAGSWTAVLSATRLRFGGPSFEITVAPARAAAAPPADRDGFPAWVLSLPAALLAALAIWHVRRVRPAGRAA